MWASKDEEIDRNVMGTNRNKLRVLEADKFEAKFSRVFYAGKFVKELSGDWKIFLIRLFFKQGNN